MVVIASITLSLCSLHAALGIYRVQQQGSRMSRPALAHSGPQSGGSEEQEPQGSQRGKTGQELSSAFLLRNWCLEPGRFGMCRLCAV